MIKIERRSADMAAAEDGSLKIEGYAAVFGQRTLLYESPFSGYKYYEEVMEGAFTGADMSQTVLRYNHEGSCLPLARSSSGTLSLTPDKYGLKISAELADTQNGRDIYTLIRRGDLNKMSFAFTVLADAWSENREEKIKIRTISRFKTVYDVSIVDFPAYDGTTVQARAAGEIRKEIADMERRRNLLLRAMC